MKPAIYLVTGGLGFIGKYFIDKVLKQDDYVICIDKITYAADINMISEFTEKYHKFQFGHLGIEDLTYLPEECDYIINFAAETHVDNSISDSTNFINSNIVGVQNILELIRHRRKDRQPKFIQISTDEVYGDSKEFKTEDASLNPSNPYASTKAAADLMIKAWSRTYDIDYNIIRMSNAYGVNQYPEKLIPKACMCLSRGLPVPIQGTGEYKRTWLYVKDAIEGIITIINKGNNKEIYNISGNIEYMNINIIAMLADIYNISPDKAFITVDNRKGQDIQYHINSDKITKLGWKSVHPLISELRVIVSSFNIGRFNKSWKGKILSK